MSAFRITQGPSLEGRLEQNWPGVEAQCERVALSWSPLASCTDLLTGNFLLLGQAGGPGSLTEEGAPFPPQEQTRCEFKAGYFGNAAGLLEAATSHHSKDRKQSFTGRGAEELPCPGEWSAWRDLWKGRSLREAQSRAPYPAPLERLPRWLCSCCPCAKGQVYKRKHTHTLQCDWCLFISPTVLQKLYKPFCHTSHFVIHRLCWNKHTKKTGNHHGSSINPDPEEDKKNNLGDGFRNLAVEVSLRRCYA